MPDLLVTAGAQAGYTCREKERGTEVAGGSRRQTNEQTNRCKHKATSDTSRQDRGGWTVWLGRLKEFRDARRGWPGGGRGLGVGVRHYDNRPDKAAGLHMRIDGLQRESSITPQAKAAATTTTIIGTDRHDAPISPSVHYQSGQIRAIREHFACIAKRPPTRGVG